MRSRVAQVAAGLVSLDPMERAVALELLTQSVDLRSHVSDFTQVPLLVPTLPSATSSRVRDVRSAFSEHFPEEHDALIRIEQLSMANDAACDHLREALKSSSAKLREHACLAAAAWASAKPELHESLLIAVTDPDRYVRAAAVYALAEYIATGTARFNLGDLPRDRFAVQVCAAALGMLQ